jgi:hypothetical protein
MVVEPVIGMFLVRGQGWPTSCITAASRIYPLGLPNGFEPRLTAMRSWLGQGVFRLSRQLPFLPEPFAQLVVSLGAMGRAIRVALCIVFRHATLEKMLLSVDYRARIALVLLKFVAVEQRPFSLLRAFAASLVGRLASRSLPGVHVEEADEISIEGEGSDVILDGETFRAGIGKPILLRSALPLSFVRLAA